jgi:hypothetical protein
MTNIVEDQLQAKQHMDMRDLWYPLADPQVDRQMFRRLNEHIVALAFGSKNARGLSSKTTL